MKTLELNSPEMKKFIRGVEKQIWYELAEDRLSELEDKQKWSNLKNRKKKTMKKSEQWLRDLWETIEYTNMEFQGQIKEGKGQKKYSKK